MARLFVGASLPMMYSQGDLIRPHIRQARSETLRKIQETVHQTYGTDYRVKLFGSTSYGVDSPASDLDLVIMVGARFHSHSPSSLNSDQDTNRMDGFPPSLDLKSLPRKYILPPMNHQGTHIIRKLSTM